ncbi:hypothetical protein RRG08_043680 [Elysia crispata]|uniref:Uncharacterized protein n=1 Tax=Elysia crispata TaxID=231223 RepID=A0AAE1DN54_9GAST|nr:hypothetical protein RRG08_043680 [Elysia crispata]
MRSRPASALILIAKSRAAHDLLDTRSSCRHGSIKVGKAINSDDGGFSTLYYIPEPNYWESRLFVCSFSLLSMSTLFVWLEDCCFPLGEFIPTCAGCAGLVPPRIVRYEHGSCAASHRAI